MMIYCEYLLSTNDVVVCIYLYRMYPVSVMVIREVVDYGGPHSLESGPKSYDRLFI